MKITKNRKQMLNNFDTTKIYEPLEAIKILKEKSYESLKKQLIFQLILELTVTKLTKILKVL